MLQLGIKINGRICFSANFATPNSERTFQKYRNKRRVNENDKKLFNMNETYNVCTNKYEGFCKAENEGFLRCLEIEINLN